MYECPNCAGNLKFDIHQQKLHCEHCGTLLDPYDISKERDAEEHSDEYEVTIFTCPQCGGELISEDTTAATFCSFCGSATILDSRVSKERRPAHIIPFSKTKEDCKKAYAQMMHRAIFAPNEYKDPENIEKFRGIYMPYWVYSFEKNGPVTMAASKSYRRGDYVYTNHYDLDCTIDASYKGLTFDASSSFADNLSEAIAPFDLRQGKEFAPTFLSGFYADTNDVKKYVYEDNAEELVIEDASDRLSRAPGCGRYSISNYALERAVTPTKTTSELAMFPVWFLSYRNGDRVSYAVVNGQTGKVAAEIPVDPKKYVIGSAILALPIFFLLNLMFTLKPASVLGIAIVLALISVIISNRQIKRLFARKTMEDDEGLASVQVSDATVSDANLADAMADGREAQTRTSKKERKSSKTGLPSILYSYLIVFAVVLLLMGLFPMLMFSAMNGNFVSVTRLVGAISNLISYGVFFAVAATMIFVVRMLIHIGSSKSIYNNKKQTTTKVTFKEKFKTTCKPIAGIVTAILILIINPVHDWYYYIGVIVCLGMVMWGFMDIIKNHNELTTRKLPQFNRRGGDENA